MAATIFKGPWYGPPHGHESKFAVSLRDLVDNLHVIGQLVTLFPGLVADTCSARAACASLGTRDEALGSDARCLTTIFHHLRRLKRDGNRWRQACRRVGTIPSDAMAIKTILDRATVKWAHEADCLGRVGPRTTGTAVVKTETTAAAPTVQNPVGPAADTTEAGTAAKRKTNVGSATPKKSASPAADRPTASGAKDSEVDRLLGVYGALASKRGGAKGPRHLWGGMSFLVVPSRRPTGVDKAEIAKERPGPPFDSAASN